ncbi:hypothetical protein MNBD_GAMMA09-1747 [hydrothermal vent metagenome]|uniref:Uncharacterized protein n=1 Tax=hydrothermal vent metagenome TaxID=652676 RepID=A0A3B0XX56_9ZZZZ
MSDQPQLHSSIVAMISLASGIASNHPAMGQCQLARLRKIGVAEHQIAAVIEIARHIRDEASEKLDFAFNEASGVNVKDKETDSSSNTTSNNTQADTSEEVCDCTPTPSGLSCC